MAQAGEIRFDAIIDTSGYEKGVKDIQNATDEIKESRSRRTRPPKMLARTVVRTRQVLRTRSVKRSTGLVTLRTD